MTLTYSDIEPYIDAGYTTAAEIKGQLDLIPLYKNDIKATSSVDGEVDMLDILDSYGLLWIQADAQYWHGPLVDAVNAAANDDLTQGLGDC